MIDRECSLEMSGLFTRWGWLDAYVRFRVCGLAAADYGYLDKDFLEFIEVAPSAITELVHWQQQGYSLITPVVMDKKHSIEEIR